MSWRLFHILHIYQLMRPKSTTLGAKWAQCGVIWKWRTSSMEAGISTGVAKGEYAQRVCPNDPRGCRSACQVVILGLRSALISAVSSGRSSVAAGRCQCRSKQTCSGRRHAVVVGAVLAALTRDAERWSPVTAQGEDRARLWCLPRPYRIAEIGGLYFGWIVTGRLA